jgi:ligand-binding sensor domain-containing protein
MPLSHGLEPSTHITQYGHLQWKIGENGLESEPLSIAQTADGYIWIGTGDGLYRFDGIRFVRWSPPAGEHLPSEQIVRLIGGKDGSLYIAAESGVSRLTNGHLYNYPEHSIGNGPFLDDGRGSIWVGRSDDSPAGASLCRMGYLHLSCYGKKDGIDCKTVTSLTSDKPGSFWIGSWQGVCHWTQGVGSQTFALPRSSPNDKRDIDATALAHDRAGRFWVGIPRTGPKAGLLTFDGTNWTSFIAKGIDGRQTAIRTMSIDRNNNLWVGTDDQGLYKINGKQVDHIDAESGLRSSSVAAIFEDREKNIWVITPGGIDVFRDLAVISFSSREGLSDNLPTGIDAQQAGAVWVATRQALYRMQNGRFSKVDAGPMKGDYGLLIRDSENRLWVEDAQHLYCYQNGRFIPVTGPNGSRLGFLINIREDNDHHVWVSVLDEKTRERSLQRVENFRIVEKVPSSMIAGGQTLYAMAPNPKGGLWISGFGHGLYWFHDGHSEQVKLDGYDGPVHDLNTEGDGVWITTDKRGLIWYRDGFVRALTTKSGLPCDTIFDLTNDHRGSYWIHSSCGLIRIHEEEIRRWKTDSTYQIKSEIFDSSEGVENSRYWVSSLDPQGRLWSENSNIVQMMDPVHLPSNPIPPPVQIERVLVDRKDRPVTNDLKLPVSPREIQIDYTGLSFVVPEKVSFRYHLDGYDKGWVDAGQRREAFYNDLRPGSYTFQVIACNNDGVWSTHGALLSFRVPPAWWQTIWFRVLCFLVFFGLLYLVYLVRLRHHSNTLKIRFEERLEERTRLARNLHDTMLQTIQGSRLVADFARNNLQDPVATANALSRLSDCLGRATFEGRVVLDSLRIADRDQDDITSVIQHSIKTYVFDESVRVNIAIDGQSKEMQPIARDEVYRIVDEAIRNACLHSGARRIDVGILFEENFILRVCDNGKGIDPETLKQGKTGHYGLIGMRERAAHIGAKLMVSSSPQGTNIELRVPGKAIYRSSPSGRLTRLFNRQAS